MANAIWIILYDLKHTREAEYLEWFHDVHIPEKLARQGYTWAAHYQVMRDGQNADQDNGYIAMFGGQASSVFYNPSPAQIKPTQTTQTKDMMSCRSNARSLILSAEWAANRDGVVNDSKPVIDAEMISVTLCDTAGYDEDYGAWLIQNHLKSIVQDGACSNVQKLLASTGNAKHAIIHQHANPTTSPLMSALNKSDEWNKRVEGYIRYPLGDPQTGKRLWPTPS